MTRMVGPLRRACQIAPDAEAVICGDVRLTYAETWERCRRLAGALRGLGVGEGDRHAVALSDTESSQRPGQSPAPLPRLGVRQPDVPADDCFRIRRDLARPAQRTDHAGHRDLLRSSGPGT